MYKKNIFTLFAILTLVVVGCNTPAATQESQTQAPTRASQPTLEPLMPSASPTPAPLRPLGPPGSWSLLFSDEFNGNALDQNRWKTCFWWDDGGCTISSNRELEWYQPENVRLEDGALILEARQQEITGSDGKNYPFTSGMVSSGRITSDKTRQPGFTFRYGYAEIRTRVPKGQGLWPAFWMLPISHKSKPEIDIMEILGHESDKVKMNFHYISLDGQEAKTGGEWSAPDFSADWHTFGVDWQPNQIIWYVDGVAQFKFSEAAYVPSEPMYLILNLAVGGDWPGNPDASTPFPSRFEIDYVRVFRRADTVYLEPLADAYVNSAREKENFGAGEAIYSDGEPKKIGFLEYDTTPFAGRQLSLAYLRIHTTEDVGSPSNNAHTVSLTESTGWKEELINAMSYPTIGETLGTIEEATWVNTVYLIPLDVNTLQEHLGSVFTLSISTAGPDGLYLYTRESLRGGVQLILTFADENAPE